jgi:hypothetical protein
MLGLDEPLSKLKMIAWVDSPDFASPTVGHTTPDYLERYIVDHAPTMRPVPVHTVIE